MKNKLYLSLLLGLSLVLILSGCAEVNTQNQTINEPVINETGAQDETNIQNETKTQSLYDFCVNNSGQVLGTYPAQCVLNGILYFNETDNAMMLFTCTGYYDGCNMCSVEDNKIMACTLMYCEPPVTGTPKCTGFNETLPEWTPKQASANFSCSQGKFSVVFDNVKHLAFLNMTGKVYELPQMVSADGSRYSDQRVSLFVKGDSAEVFDAKKPENFLYENCTAE